MTDDLSLKSYWPEVTFNEAIITGARTFLPREGAVSVDAYNAASLTQSTLASALKVQSYQRIQGGAFIESIKVEATDHGTGDATAPPDDVTPVVTEADAEADGFAQQDAEVIGADITVESVDTRVFQGFADTVTMKSDVITLRATATGTLFKAPKPTVFGDNPDTDMVETDHVVTAGVAGMQGLRDNPITRVDFYAAVAPGGGAGLPPNTTDALLLMFIGSVGGDAAGAEDFASDVEGTVNDSRRYIYEMKISEDDFLAMVGDDDGDYGDGEIVAFAVKDNKGIALSGGGEDLNTSPADP